MGNESSGEPETETANQRALQRQIGRARESIAETVEEIKETAGQSYASVKETVSGVLDYREEFQKEPLVWSLGALSAGFALGYTLGYAHKSSRRGKRSAALQFADRIANELSSVGQSLVMPALNVKIKDLFGFDFTELLKDMRGEKKRSSGRAQSLPASKSSSTKRRRLTNPNARKPTRRKS